MLPVFFSPALPEIFADAEELLIAVTALPVPFLFTVPAFITPVISKKTPAAMIYFFMINIQMKI